MKKETELGQIEQTCRRKPSSSRERPNRSTTLDFHLATSSPTTHKDVFSASPDSVTSQDKSTSGTDRRSKKSATIDAPNTSHCEWSPDGRYLLCATLSPRLRVDNGLRGLPLYGDFWLMLRVLRNFIRYVFLLSLPVCKRLEEV